LRMLLCVHRGQDVETSECALSFARVFLNTEGAEDTERRGKKEAGRDATGLGVAAMRNGSIGMDNCQGTVLQAYHSN
jgi:hypothetical protein